MENIKAYVTESGVPYVHLTDIPKTDIFKTFDCGQCFRFDPVSLYGNKYEYGGPKPHSRHALGIGKQMGKADKCGAAMPVLGVRRVGGAALQNCLIQPRIQPKAAAVIILGINGGRKRISLAHVPGDVHKQLIRPVVSNALEAAIPVGVGFLLKIAQAAAAHVLFQRLIWNQRGKHQKRVQRSQKAKERPKMLGDTILFCHGASSFFRFLLLYDSWAFLSIKTGGFCRKPPVKLRYFAWCTTIWLKGISMPLRSHISLTSRLRVR